MTPEASTTKKRSLVQRTTPAPDGDHRKRPRNRATKSCLNCFKSKRMCDRKRPCTRCTQLGLTGLCVYEVDDPQQSSDTQDEQARLKRRVAELEGVIRELKNKPHPRWVLPTLNGDTSANQLWRPRSQSAPTRKGQGMSSTAAAPLNQTSPCSSTSSLSPPILAVDIANGGSYFPPFSLPSPVSGTPSPSARTPIQDFPPDMNHGDAAAHFGLDQDLASLLAVSCQGLVDVHEGILESMPDHFAEGSSPMNAGHTPSDIAFHELCDTQTAMQAHCACLTEPTNYHALLELSLRLRRAADILSRSSHHCSGSYCHLLQRIAELDLLTTNTLGNILTPPDIASTLSSRGVPASPNHLSPRIMHASKRGEHSVNHSPGLGTVSPRSLHSMPQWGPMGSGIPTPTGGGDAFMSWDPRTHPQSAVPHHG